MQIPLSLSFSRVLLPLRPTLSFSRIKGFSGRSVDLYPPRGSNPPPQDRRGAVYPLSYDELRERAGEREGGGGGRERGREGERDPQSKSRGLSGTVGGWWVRADEGVWAAVAA